MPDPHSVLNYTIGKGILSIGEWNGATPPSSYEDMGNCSSIEMTPTVERLPHYSSRASFKTKDKNPVIQQEYSLTFVADEMAAKNLNRFLLGTRTNNVIAGLQNTDQEYAIKFVSNNPLGPNQTWEFWKATLAPNGALQLIGDEWMSMTFLAEGLADTANHASSPYFTVTYVTTTTTT